MSKNSRFRLQRNPLAQPTAVQTLSSPKVAPLTQAEILNLDRINLEDRGNWLRALEACRPMQTASLPDLLNQIAAYQGQIDKAIQTAQAQSTIYAYAIGTRLDFIEQERLYEMQGYRNLTEFINAGEVRRPAGDAIAPRQVWAYRRVTRGLNEFLDLVESLRGGADLPQDVKEQIKRMGQQIQSDVVQSFLGSYIDGIAGVLELGVSKLEQVYRLPKPIALTGLLAGQLPLSETFVPVHNISFSQLRKAISLHEQQRKGQSKPSLADQKLEQLERLIEYFGTTKLSASQQKKLQALMSVLESSLSHSGG